MSKSSSVMKKTPELPAQEVFGFKFVYSDIIANYDVSEPIGYVDSMSIDAEWSNVLEHLETLKVLTPVYLSKQYTLKTSEDFYTVILWSSEHPLPKMETVKTLRVRYGRVVVIQCEVQNTTLFDCVELLGLDFGKTCKVHMFYSYQDINACILGRGQENAAHLLNDHITKTRNINGKVTLPQYGLNTEFKITDLFGAFNTSLSDAFTMVGMEETYKHLTDTWYEGLMDSWDKGRMEEFISKDPDNFLRYICGDSYDLFELWSKRVEQLNELVEESLGFNPNLNTNNCPRSSGSLVSLVFQKWLAFEHMPLMTSMNALTEVPLKAVHKFRGFKEFLKTWDRESEPEFPYETKKGVKFESINLDHPGRNFQVSYKDGHENVAGMSGASIRGFGVDTRSSACFNALVHGGRCVNENPYQFELKDVIDPDYDSCYGSALAEFTFPVGLPTIYSWIQEKPLTLGEFLARNERELVDDLYQILVSGNLSFDQTLVHSKIGVTQASIARDLGKIGSDDNEDVCIDSREVDVSHIEGKFILLKNEIQNGVITADVLKTIRSVSTNVELKEWMALEVVTAAYYPKSRQKGVDELTDILCNRPGGIYKGKNTGVKDTRTRNWCAVPLSGFIGKFVETRRKLKKLKRVKGDTYDIKQNALKLFINTTYGCFASPFFAMGNAILANNITAKARTALWMASIALGSANSITDGGLFSNNGVRFLKDSNGKKPGFGVMAVRSTMESHRNIKVGKLVDNFEGLYQQLKAGSKEAQENLNQLITNHINGFWKAYGSSVPFKIEVKFDNVAKRAITWGSADYLLLDPVKATHELNGTPYSVKVRGAKEDDHPKKYWLLWLANVATHEEYQDAALGYEYENGLGINEWKQGALAGNSLYLSGEVLPADRIIKTTNHRPNLLHVPVRSETHYQTRSKQHDKAVRAHQKTLNSGVNECFDLGAIDNLKSLDREIQRRLKLSDK